MKLHRPPERRPSRPEAHPDQDSSLPLIARIPVPQRRRIRAVFLDPESRLL